MRAEPGHKDRERSGNSNHYRVEIALGTVTMVAWLLLFTGGLAIYTEPYFQNIMDHSFAHIGTRQYLQPDEVLAEVKKKYPAQLDKKKEYVDYEIDSYNNRVFLKHINKNSHPIESFFAIFFFYTLSNIAILCLLAGMMGTVVRRLKASPHRSGNAEGKASASLVRECAEAMMGAFVVYLIILSGAFALFSLSLNPPQPDQVRSVNEARMLYAKMATLTTVVSLIEGYNPFILNFVINKTKDMFSGAKKPPSDAAPPPAPPTGGAPSS